MSSIEKIPMRQLFSDRLKTIRESRAYKSAEMADYLGFSQPVYSRYENGRMPDVDTVAVIADKCGVTVDWLLGRDDSPATVNLHCRPATKVEKGRANSENPENIEDCELHNRGVMKLEKVRGSVGGGCLYPEKCDLEGELSAVRERLAGMEDELGYMRSQLDTVVGLLGAALGDPLSKGKQERKAG